MPKTYTDIFQVLYDKAPQSLKNIIDSTKGVEQSPIWHPEGDVYIHTKLVTNRLHNQYHGDINLDLSGLFHDLGKIDTTIWNDKKKTWSAHGHEDDSVKYVDKYKFWVQEMGGDYDIVRYTVLNHMSIKFFKEFKMNRKMEMLSGVYFTYVLKFTTADYGGTDLGCKTIMDLSEYENQIEVYYKTQEENKIIASKFNGKILMSKYPELKGKKLGDIINGFKNNVNDFRLYVLGNDSEYILKDFDNFYKNYNYEE